MNGIMEHSAGNKEELEMIYVSSNSEMSQRVIQIIKIEIRLFCIIVTLVEK
ncbi:hypothetical protein [Pseudalkalibacillus hwajinpoensis]|uniref:hypothetical protein n=1 Tax=Guptibacillus hwajinpoensis TaxID=208199 RepID=UPI001CFCE664|nr:hypothetical protein [Pseudalkalibacillus hwajinpoensis]